MQKERRKADRSSQGALRRELSDAQQTTLAELEHFGWELKFIRHPMFQEAVAVVIDANRKNFAVLQKDGTLNERPGFDIRK